jgi:filamentous hemagglutinin
MGIVVFTSAPGITTSGTIGINAAVTLEMTAPISVAGTIGVRGAVTLETRNSITATGVIGINAGVTMSQPVMTVTGMIGVSSQIDVKGVTPVTFSGRFGIRGVTTIAQQNTIRYSGTIGVKSNVRLVSGKNISGLSATIGVTGRVSLHGSSVITTAGKVGIRTLVTTRQDGASCVVPSYNSSRWT